MIIEITRLIDRWLKHDVYGVGAMLQSVERFTPEGDEDEMPEIPSIFNDTEDEMGDLMEPIKTPALVTFCARGPTVNLRDKLYQRGGQAIAYVTYITRDVPDLMAARDGNYVLRAAKKSLTAYNSYAQAIQYRKLNNILIAELGDLTEFQTRSSVGRSKMWGFVQVNVRVVDSNP